ncbi:MAG: DNA primase regulatory subunit PriL [Methanomicrobiales archaeon]|nr:DNA primase regulatory subunit PriL [Methanomicrobiales archaeon]
MRVALELKDFAKYPFLKESQQFMGRNADSIEEFLSSNSGKIALRHAMDRIRAALRPSGQRDREEDLPSDGLGVKISVSGYVLARIIVSCAGDRSLVERLARYEAQRAFRFLIDEEEEKRLFVAGSIGMNGAGSDLPVIQYVEIVAGLHEERWRLVNRDVESGQVRITPAEMNELLREQVRVILLRQLPLRVPETVCSLLQPQTEEIRGIFQQTMLEQFGAVEEDAFPPCMQALIAALTGGTNIPHAGRFALTAFLHNIGMAPADIIALFCRAPDFDLGKTQYQVEHISGRGGTEYTAPSCAAMRTYGICVHSDRLCEKINHPLNYYRIRKKKGKKPEPGESTGTSQS